MKPLIFYVDDEPHNLTVFEAALPEEWEIKTFTNAFEALEALSSLRPTVLVSDQRMPQITGVKYLELAKKIDPEAIRIIVTGYSEEDLVVESVRKAQIYDYIKKPWEPEQLEVSIRQAIDLYNANQEAKRLHQELLAKTTLLEEQNRELNKIATELKLANLSEAEMLRELQCWAPPFLLEALRDNSIKFPIRKDLVGITFDIIGSADLHDLFFDGKPLRGWVIQAFSEAVLRNGGWRESHGGDSAYGHFGLLGNSSNPSESALAAAREFRVSLRSISERYNVKIECGIAVHVANDAIVNVHTVHLNTPNGPITQKSFDTTSTDIDLLHRMEKMVHSLPGTNIILSKEFLDTLKNAPDRLQEIGIHHFKGQTKDTSLFILTSDKVTEDNIKALRTSLSSSGKSANDVEIAA